MAVAEVQAQIQGQVEIQSRVQKQQRRLRQIGKCVRGFDGDDGSCGKSERHAGHIYRYTYIYILGDAANSSSGKRVVHDTH